MNIKTAINKYRSELNDAIYNKHPFKMLRCGLSCGCVFGIEFKDIKFSPPFLYTRKYKFKLSCDISNKLEDEWRPLIQPERLEQTWEDRNLYF